QRQRLPGPAVGEHDDPLHGGQPARRRVGGEVGVHLGGEAEAAVAGEERRLDVEAPLLAVHAADGGRRPAAGVSAERALDGGEAGGDGEEVVDVASVEQEHDTVVSHMRRSGITCSATVPASESPAGDWLLLIHQLPTDPAYLRVKVARRLRRL